MDDEDAFDMPLPKSSSRSTDGSHISVNQAMPLCLELTRLDKDADLQCSDNAECVATTRHAGDKHLESNSMHLGYVPHKKELTNLEADIDIDSSFEAASEPPTERPYIDGAVGEVSTQPPYVGQYADRESGSLATPACATGELHSATAPELARRKDVDHTDVIIIDDDGALISPGSRNDDSQLHDASDAMKIATAGIHNCHKPSKVKKAVRAGRHTRGSSRRRDGSKFTRIDAVGDDEDDLGSASSMPSNTKLASEMPCQTFFKSPCGLAFFGCMLGSLFGCLSVWMVMRSTLAVSSPALDQGKKHEQTAWPPSPSAMHPWLPPPLSMKWLPATSPPPPLSSTLPLSSPSLPASVRSLPSGVKRPPLPPLPPAQPMLPLLDTLRRISLVGIELSSTCCSIPASQCIDDDLETVCHSALRTLDPWMSVAMEGTSSVSHVHLINRPGFEERLGKFEIC